MGNSKPLMNSDTSGAEFAQEMLSGDKTAGINFDRLQKHPEKGYIIFEYLLCEEDQPIVTPYTSHPNKYWYKNSRKFISLSDVAEKLEAKLVLVNYAKKGTKHEDEILVMQVTSCTDEKIETKDTRMTRETFKAWFRKLSTECL